MSKDFTKAYNPQETEDKIYKKWEESGFFNPDNLNLPDDAETYTIILPPPNITAKLHLGHASMLAIEDLMIRFHRMNGYRTLWVPGTDHAAIATQNAVEKKLFKETGQTRHDLGKEEFLKKVWEFLRETQATILHQFRKMGASLDWSREAFTLDDQRKKAVKRMFIDMYNEGIIYRGERIVNWCPRCKSTLADDEVEYKEQKAKFYTFKYWQNFPFAISTTRPETKLGDTAVAVNPKDERYKKFIGQIFEGEFCGVPLKIKVIADQNVEAEFGTGALGVTPAHSMVDWKMAEENDLLIVKVINEDGKIYDGFGKFSNLTADEARKKVVEKLRENNLIEKEEEIENNLSVCYRCNTAIEPLPSQQWFVSVDKKLERLGGKSLKEKSIEVAENKEIEFLPFRFTKRYLDWMMNLHDWCISRQIWFGHEIPAWYREISKHEMKIYGKDIFESIKNGSKKYETRAFKEKFAKIKKGDLIEFSLVKKNNENEILEKITLKVKDIFNFDSVEKMCDELGVENIIKMNVEELKKWYEENIPNLEERLEKGGIFAFELEKSFEQKEIYVGEEKPDEKYNRVVLLHAWGSNPEQAFFPWLKNNLENQGIKVEAPILPNAENPDFDEWLSELKKLNIDENTLVVGRSLGTTLALAGAMRGVKIGKLVSVCTPLKNDAISEFFEKNGKWNFDKMRENINETVVFHSTNDPYIPREMSAKISKELNASLIEIENVEHFAGEEYQEILDKVQKSFWNQDKDSLDTWFSSGMWTFSTLGWPDNFQNGEKTGDLKKFHPTQVLETGFEILTLWVSRMIMMSLFAVNEIPFEKVYLHGTVLDKFGKKMSKSKGNGIDPLDMTEKYGTDATRLSLLIGNTPGNDLKFNEDKVEQARNFVNKIWNIGRYISNSDFKLKKIDDLKNIQLSTADKWILTKLVKTNKEVTENLKQYNFSMAGEILRNFTWNEFADWYVEIHKIEKNDTILAFVYKQILKMWHPFIPFVTEKIWQEMFAQNENDLLLVEKWTTKENLQSVLSDFNLENSLDLVQELIVKVRNIRATYNVEAGKKVKIVLIAQDDKMATKNDEVIKRLAGVAEIEVRKNDEKPEKSASDVVGDLKLYVCLGDVIDIEKEKSRIEQDLEKTTDYKNGLEKRLASEFVKKAPQDVVEKERENLRVASEKIGKLEESLRNLS